MANCFGAVIDNFKLDTLPRYVGKPKTQEDRARVASDLENDKSDEASSYVRSLKTWYGNGASTLCLVYNQTGETLHYVCEKDWLGFIGRTPYPTEIGNGQWAAFLHVHDTGVLASGSQGAVVYRGKDKNGQEKDFLLAWRAPAGFIRNKAYCSIGDTINYFQPDWAWRDVKSAIDDSGYSDSATREACEIVADIGEGFSPVYTARIKIPHSK